MRIRRIEVRSHLHNGAVVVWKPIGVSSREALEEVERRLGVRPLGHTGSLDPLACGILVLLGGEARKFQNLFTRYPKVYRARIVLGMGSDSEDGEGPLWCPLPRAPLPERDAIERALDRFLGVSAQVPPRLSAVRIRGQRAYARTRRGEPVDPKPREVTIYSLEILRWGRPVLEIVLSCSAGTYVRSLARDLGAELGTAGFLAGLRRVGLGPFTERDAIPLSAVSACNWLTIEEAMRHEPAVELSEDNAERLYLGQQVTAPDRGATQGQVIAWCSGRVLGVVDTRGQRIYPRRLVRRTLP